MFISDFVFDERIVYVIIPFIITIIIINVVIIIIIIIITLCIGWRECVHTYS